jgi:hypothetical protein
MTEVHVSINQELLSDRPNGPDGLARLLESVPNQILETQATKALGGGCYERHGGRVDYQNGHTVPVLFYTQIGPLTLLSPRGASGGYPQKFGNVYLTCYPWLDSNGINQ